MRTLLLALLSTLSAAHAATWQPERNVELIVGTAPGGGSDSTARLIQRLFQDKKLIERPSVVRRCQVLPFAYRAGNLAL